MPADQVEDAREKLFPDQRRGDVVIHPAAEQGSAIGQIIPANDGKDGWCIAAASRVETFDQRASALES